MESIIRRAASKTSDDELDHESPQLSSGAIAAIAIVAGICFFGVLSFLVICCSRRRHRNKKAQADRNLDLEDDEDCIVDSASHPQDLTLTKSESNSFYDGTDPKMQQWYATIQRQTAYETSTGKPIPAFHVTTQSMTSWNNTSRVSSEDIITRPPTAVTQSTQMFTFGPAPVPAYPYPKPFVIRPSQQELGPPAQARHARHRSQNSIITVRNASTTERQLTTILRSTSQRLRDSQRSNIGSTSQGQSQPQGARVSILNAIVTDSPTERPATPERASILKPHNKNLALSPIKNEEDLCSSSHTSVLDMFYLQSRDSSCDALSRVPMETPTKSRIEELDDDAESLVDDRIDLDDAKPKGLHSPSKKINFLQRTFSKRKSTDAATKIHEDNRISFVSSDATAHGGFEQQTEAARKKARSVRESIDDPFVVKGSPADLKQKEIDAAKAALEKNSFSIRPLRLNQSKIPSGAGRIGKEGPLRIVTDNNQNQKWQHTSSGPIVTAGQVPLTFKWPQPWPNNHTHDAQDVSKPQLVGSGAAQPKPVARGHKRSRSQTRISRPMLHRNSISIVPEEGDDLTAEPIHPPTEPMSNMPTTFSTTSISSAILENLPVLEPPTSPTRWQRPPSQQSEISIKPSSASPVRDLYPLSRNDSVCSYSATMSLYDLYSSPDASRSPSHSPSRNGSSSRSPSRYNSTRRSNSVRSTSTSSILSTSPGKENVTPGQNRSNSLSLSRRSTVTGVSFALSASQLAREAAEKERRSLAPLPAKHVSAVKGPRDQLKPPARDSVQASIGLLRRMNSAVSNYSLQSDKSGESPTLPAYRGGGCSVGREKSFRRGSVNYYSLGLGAKGYMRAGAASLEHSPTRQPSRRNGIRASASAVEGFTTISRTNSGSPVKERKLLFEPNNALGLVFPVLAPPSTIFYEVKPIKSSPTLGQEEKELKPKDSGCDLSSDSTPNSEAKKDVMPPPMPVKSEKRMTGMGAAGGNSKGVEKVLERASLYDDMGFLVATPERRKVVET